MNSVGPRNQILIIEKSNGGSFLLISMLNQHNFELKSVSSYLKAVEYCAGTGYLPDLIIVDQPKPCPIFFEFPRKFMERTMKQIPIVAYSLTDDKETISKALESGYKDFLVRPIEPEILYDKITGYVSPTTSLNDETYPFSVNENAVVELEAHLDLINEFGATIKTKFPFSSGMRFSLNSPTLKSNGVDGLRVSVIDTNQIIDPEFDYSSKLVFLGLNPKELETIRRIAINKGYKKAV